MEVFDGQFALDNLVSSEARLLGTLSWLTPEQWNFRAGPGQWSILEIVEHLAVFEDFIRGVVERALAAPEQGGNADASRGKETLVMGLAMNRDVKLISRDAVRPCGRWPKPADAVDAFKRTRSASISFCQGTQGNLRGRFFTHIAFGDLDCFQWLLLLGQHTLRHVLQIEEIKANQNYPASRPCQECQ